MELCAEGKQRLRWLEVTRLMAERLDRRDTEAQCSVAQRQHNKTHYNAMQQGNETVGREQCHRSIAWRVISSDAKPAAQKGLRQAERKGASNLVFFFSPNGTAEPRDNETGGWDGRYQAYQA